MVPHVPVYHRPTKQVYRFTTTGGISRKSLTVFNNISGEDHRLVTRQIKI